MAAADVRLLDPRFETISAAVIKKSGAYTLEVERGLYDALMVLRMRDYAKAQFESGKAIGDTSRLDFGGGIYRNGEQLNILEMNRVFEDGGQIKLRAYLLQVSLPEKSGGGF